ncbi:MAG: hypothetical protein IKN18_00320, partial [Neisseriaceae bacterium]|nr:hypothetical protein [Neisseriaceae bacterium]
DLVGAGNPNLPNGSSDVANGEVPLPKDVTKNNDSWLPDVSVDLVANAAFAPGVGPNDELGINLVKYDSDGLKFGDGGYVKIGGVTGGGFKVEGSANIQMTVGGSSDGMHFEKCASIKKTVGVGGCIGFSGDTKKPYISGHIGFGGGGGIWADSGVSESWTWEDVTKEQN